MCVCIEVFNLLLLAGILGGGCRRNLHTLGHTRVARNDRRTHFVGLGHDFLRTLDGVRKPTVHELFHVDGLGVFTRSQDGIL